MWVPNHLDETAIKHMALKALYPYPNSDVTIKSIKVVSFADTINGTILPLGEFSQFSRYMT